VRLLRVWVCVTKKPLIKAVTLLPRLQAVLAGVIVLPWSKFSLGQMLLMLRRSLFERASAPQLSGQGRRGVAKNVR